MLKKLIYSLIILCLVISPIKVFASGSVEVTTKRVDVSVGSRESVNIKVYNALARATIISSDESVAILVDESGNKLTSNKWISKADGENKYTDNPIYIKGLKVGTAKITISVFDATTYDMETLKIDDIEIEVNVTEASIVSEYKITYNANGGKDAPVTQTKKAGEDINLSTVRPIRDGEYEFAGWNTKADGSGKTYQPGNKYTEDANLTLYALWVEPSDTGDTLIYVVLLLTLGALIYSYWYMKRVQEN